MIDEIKREHLRRIGILGGSVRSAHKAEAARQNCAKAGRSRSESKIAAARVNGKRGGRPARVRSVAEIVAEEARKFKRAHAELFQEK